MSADNRQVAFRLATEDHDRLKRLSVAQNKPFAAVVSLALLRLEEPDPPSTSAAASRRLVIYAQLSEPDRAAWKKRIRDLRQRGGSYASIAKRLFRDEGLSASDGLPLSASTIRGICAL